MRRRTWNGGYTKEWRHTKGVRTALPRAFLPLCDWQPSVGPSYPHCDGQSCWAWANITPNTWLGRRESKPHLLHLQVSVSSLLPEAPLHFRLHSHLSLWQCVCTMLNSSVSSSKSVCVFTWGKRKGCRHLVRGRDVGSLGEKIPRD